MVLSPLICERVDTINRANAKERAAVRLYMVELDKTTAVGFPLAVKLSSS